MFPFRHKSCLMVACIPAAENQCYFCILHTTSNSTSNLKKKIHIESQKTFQTLLQGVILLSQSHYIVNQTGADKRLVLLHIIFKEESDFLTTHFSI